MLMIYGHSHITVTLVVIVTQDWCTATAVLLHYFFLAAFFLMLAEGVQMLLYIKFVFHTRRKRETGALIFAAWCKYKATVTVLCLSLLCPWQYHERFRMQRSVTARCMVTSQLHCFDN